MTDYRKSEILTGLFVCLAIVVFCLFAFRIGKFDLLGFLKGEVVICRAYFTDVKTLGPGSVVKVGGQRVGKITAVRMVEKPLTRAQVDLIRSFSEWKAASSLTEGMIRQLIEVEFELADPRLKIDTRTAVVSLSAASLLSSHTLALDPGEWPADQPPDWPPVPVLGPDGEPEPILIATQEQTGFDELVALARPVVKNVDAVLTRLNGILDETEKAGGVAKIITGLDELMSDSRKLVAEIADRLVTDENAKNLEQTLRHLEEASRASARLTAEASALFDRSRDPRLNEFLDALARNAGEFGGRLDALQADLENVLEGAGGVIDDNRADVAESIRRLRRAMWQAEMALRKIRANPAVLFFGDEETDYEAREVDESAARHGGRAPPFGARDETIDPPE